MSIHFMRISCSDSSQVLFSILIINLCLNFHSMYQHHMLYCLGSIAWHVRDLSWNFQGLSVDGPALPRSALVKLRNACSQRSEASKPIHVSNSPGKFISFDSGQNPFRLHLGMDVIMYCVASLWWVRLLGDGLQLAGQAADMAEDHFHYVEYICSF